jgi:MFS family permease
MASDGHAWIPVFFLYMSRTLPLDQVIELSAIYYLSVFILEVPSGYFSDRIGRRSTLLLAASSLILSYCCFIIGGNFWWFAAGQFFLAAGIAMQSGTDTAFHYDSLKVLGRENEYQHREAKAEQQGLTMLAIACFSGGVLGLIDLRLAYGFSLISAITMGVIVWQFVEPVHSAERTALPLSFASVVLSCIKRLRDPLLGWIFVVVIVLYALAHIVFEFYQPYITLLQLPVLDATDYAPLISGVIIAISMFGGAIGASLSNRWHSRLGLVGILAVAMVMQLGIVAVMAIAVSPLATLLIFARNFPMALVHAPVRAVIAPRISRQQRATYLSLQGLSERLFFALLLLTLASGLNKGAPVDETTLLGILTSTFWIGVIASAFLFIFSRQIQKVLNQAQFETPSS